MKQEFKNILIVRTDRLGDIILTTPAIKILRENYPKAKLTLLVSKATWEVIKNNPYLDEILIDEREGKHKGVFGFLKLVCELASRKFDLAIVYHTKKRTNLFCFLAGIPRRIGYKNDKYGNLLNWPLKDERHSGKKHESEYCLDVLRAMDLEVKGKEFYVSLDAQAEKWVDEFCQKNQLTKDIRLIAIHIGSSDPARRWPTYRYAELVDKLGQDPKNRFMVVGDPSLFLDGEDIRQKSKFNIINTIGQTNLSQLVSLIKRCDLLISNDSGPVHLATGLYRPVVSIFTRNQPGINPTRWGPLGPKTAVVAVPEDISISFAKSRTMDDKFLEVIEAQQVFEVVDRILKLC